MSRRSTNRTRPRGRGRTARSTGVMKKLLLGTAIGMTALGAIGGVSYGLMKVAGEVRPNAIGCYESTVPQGTTTVWWDVSSSWSPSQERDIRSAIEGAWETLGFNDRFSVITTEADKVGDLAPRRVEICGPARSESDYARQGIEKTASSGFLANEADNRFGKAVQPVVDGIFAETKASGGVLAVDSPVLEQFQAISRDPGFRDVGGRKRLLVISDGIQNTEIAHFCAVKGDLPSFERFKQRPEYARVAPAAMSGVEVSFYLVLRAEYPPYCSEDELAGFWTAYFEEAGASRVDVYRLRPSGKD